MTTQSMTGFGSATKRIDSTTLAVEVRSLNHRFLEVFVHLAPELPREWEALSRKRIEKRLARGRVDVYIETKRSAEQHTPLRVDSTLAGAYHIALQELAEERQLPLDLKVLDLASLPGVIELEETLPEPEAMEPEFTETLDTAIEELVDMRRREGSTLESVMRQLCGRFQECVEAIEGAATELQQQRYSLLLERVEKLLADSEVEVPDVAGEVALIAQRSSVSEELERLNSHLKQLGEVLDDTRPKGRRLDFLIGEMGRESNTVAAKIADAKRNQVALDMKAYLEDMREQARNIE